MEAADTRELEGRENEGGRLPGVGHGEEPGFLKVGVGLPPRMRMTEARSEGTTAPGAERQHTLRPRRTLANITKPGDLSAATNGADAVKWQQTSQKLKCPRCGKSDFESSKDLGKHALGCRKKDDETNARKPVAMSGDDRMAKLLNIKRLQRRHEEEQASKEEQAKIDREMELLVKMEQARERREKALKQKQEAEAIQAKKLAEEQAKLDEEERKRRQALEKKFHERLAAMEASDEDESESDEDDQATIERRRLLREKLGLPPEEEAQQPQDDAINWLESPYEGYTAAHLAAYYDDVEHMAKIIELGGNLSTADPEGRTPLHICALYGHDGCLEQLVSISLQQMEAEAEAEAEHGCEQACLQLTRAVDNEGKTPIHIAASVANFNAVLLLGSADPWSMSIQDARGDSPLHTAAYFNYNECCDMLLQLGADPDGPMNSTTGKTPAAMCTDAATIELLVSYGADYYGIDFAGRSVLFDACASNLPDIVRYLLAVDQATQQIVCYADVRGDTPLHAACCNGHAECVQLLLEANADPCVENQAGIPPTVLALAQGHQSCIAIFEQFGIKVSVDDEADDNEEHHTPAEPTSQLEEVQHGQIAPDNNDNAAASCRENWTEYVDQETNVTYYFNEVTNVTQWECPWQDE